MATYDNIPLSWNDPLFSDNVSSGSVTLPNGGTLSNRSITQTGSIASVVLNGGATLDDIRISSREGVRIGGSGDVNISNSWLEATGQPGDHADTIQAYAPGSTGNVTITNTAIVAHGSNATAGMFIADDYSGTFTFNNVVFQGGPFGLRINADADDIYVSLTDVYFVGPFTYAPFLFQQVAADIHITRWENVHYATIVNGELVPGAFIQPPEPVEGGDPIGGSVSINDVTISEGNSGTKVATFTVTRSGGTEAFAVNYATSNGSATVADNDYAAASGTLNFGANESTKTISVTINGDTKVEGNETFNVLLSNATNGATISDGQGVGTITNDDGAAIAGSVSINNVTISEGNSGTKVATFTVTRSGGTAAFAVNFATSNGSATVADNDYEAASGTLNFGANQSTKTISVTINGDTKVEGNETFNVLLSNATNGATISDGRGVGTITNDDGAAIAGSVSINDVTISEGNSGTKVATFTVTRSGGTAAFAVNFATSNGSATVADNDYAAASGTLNFGTNQSTKTISVTINGDTKVEGNETFNVVLSNPTNGAAISDGQGTGTITNDDAGAVAISAAGDFNSNGMQDYTWRDSSTFMTMWQYNATAQKVTQADLGAVGFSWNILASDHFSNATSADQMLAQNVADGTMSLWWVNSGQRVGVDIGKYWSGINYIADGQFTNNGGAGIANFLVANTGDHHLYDWWIDSNNKLQGIDLGAVWANKSLVGTGEFSPNGRTDFLVANAGDHHLYNWWIDPASHTLQGYDLGAVWNNVEFIASGKFTANGGGNENFLVYNEVDHHLYNWWIDPTSHTLQGIDLGAAWNNVELLAAGRFSNHSANEQFLVRNTVDNHWYEWWITPQNTLAGIDLGTRPGIEFIDSRHFNNANGSTTTDEFLVRNTADGHFYEWWISNNQLQGVDLGIIA